jgi:plastocyanin
VYPQKLIGALLFVVAALPMAVCAVAAPSITGRVTGPDGKGIAEAVVFVQEPVADAAAGTRSATMDQINKTFVPGLLPIVVGTRVHFPNHDQIHHHVYSFSRTKSFELPLYKGEDAPPVLFDKAGVVKVGCNIHDWMSGIILVLPTPWFAVTDAEGQFALADLPRGTYKLAAWHEYSKEKVENTLQSVQVGMGTPEVDFKLSLTAARPRPAVHGARREP